MTYKFIYDAIHKQMEVHPIVLRIINTLPFQRLRYLKQLGNTDYVFPTAHHTRFEHSIGVSHLAGKMLRSIQTKQPELEITDEDILKVEIAGLCHDLGHGPFSHSFDKFLESLNIKSDTVHHEKRSCMILEYLVNRYNIEITSNMVKCIQDLIYPRDKSLNKPFLYHIISNSLNGIDVDKFDYLKRDTYNLGLPYSIDLERLLETARVIDEEICYPEKMLFSISNIFEIRGRLHKEVYNHPVVQAVELMIMDIFKNLPYAWENIINDPVLYLKYTDDIINNIPEEFDNAIKLRNQMLERKIYKYLEQIMIPRELYNSIDTIMNEFMNITEIKGLMDDNIRICPVHIGYNINPILKVKFYDLKKNPNKSYYLEQKKISPLLPINYEEYTIRFYIIDKTMKSIGTYCVDRFNVLLKTYEKL